MRVFFSAALALTLLGGSAAPARASDEEDFWHEIDSKLAAHGPEGLAEETESLQLGDGIVAVVASNFEFGYLAVLDHGRVRWTAHADSAAPECWRGAYLRSCLPTQFISSQLGLLPAEAGGAPRFYVVADYYQQAGATRGHQLTLWRWKNGKAEAFYDTDFVTGGEAPQAVTVTGDKIEITGKGGWQHFSVCGGCHGRQIRYDIRVTPTGIEHLGTVVLVPELDTVDELLGGNDAVATPEAVAVLKKSWHGNLFAMDPVVADHSVCVAPDDNPALTFRFGEDPARIVAIEPGPCR
jgi:hypothetical protein